MIGRASQALDLDLVAGLGGRALRPSESTVEPRAENWPLRGTLGRTDCRTFQAAGVSFDTNLRGYPNGTRVCIFGTVADASQCMTTPMLDVQTVKAWSSCP
jgi:hypothetical protein